MQKLVVHRTRNFNQTTKTFAQAWHIYAEVRFGMFYGEISLLWCGVLCLFKYSCLILYWPFSSLFYCRVVCFFFVIYMWDFIFLCYQIDRGCKLDNPCASQLRHEISQVLQTQPSGSACKKKMCVVCTRITSLSSVLGIPKNSYRRITKPWYLVNMFSHRPTDHFPASKLCEHRRVGGRNPCVLFRE